MTETRTVTVWVYTPLSGKGALLATTSDAVVAWIGRRIAAVAEIQQKEAA